MKIAIIGAGFTGLSAAYSLLKNGHQVTIFEKDLKPGGLALGFKQKNWKWSMEAHYHHLFTNDKQIFNLAKEIDQKIIIKSPETSVYVDKKIYKLDSPLSVLTFPRLTIIERLRMAFTIGLLKYNPIWKPLEKIKAIDFLPLFMGKKAYQTIWEPQLKGKFGDLANEISLAWFWARIKKRTSKLAYPEGGFLEFANRLAGKITEKGGKLYFNTEVTEIKSENKKVSCHSRASDPLKKVVPLWCGNPEQTLYFDKVIVTLPSFLFLKIAKKLPLDYQERLKKLKSLGAINLILRLKEPFFKDKTYWLSICDTTSDILAIVEHTNFMDKKNYDNEHLVYIGNYLPADHPYFKRTKEELLKIYTPYLKKINPNFELCILNSELFKSPFAQPVIPVNYSKIIPPFETPIENVYLANIDQVYPWDRGTNYAVELGEKIAKLFTND